MVWWPSHPRKDELTFRNFHVAGFQGPSEDDSLWGSQGVKPLDIVQGDVGDCYFLASSAALAEKPQRIKDIFVTDELNEEGIVAVKLYVKGKPEIVTVDTKLPWKS
jgi:hypothetical protein